MLWWKLLAKGMRKTYEDQCFWIRNEFWVPQVISINCFSVWTNQQAQHFAQAVNNSTAYSNAFYHSSFLSLLNFLFLRASTQPVCECLCVCGWLSFSRFLLFVPKKVEGKATEKVIRRWHITCYLSMYRYNLNNFAFTIYSFAISPHCRRWLAGHQWMIAAALQRMPHIYVQKRDTDIIGILDAIVNCLLILLNALP